MISLYRNITEKKWLTFLLIGVLVIFGAAFPHAVDAQFDSLPTTALSDTQDAADQQQAQQDTANANTLKTQAATASAAAQACSAAGNQACAAAQTKLAASDTALAASDSADAAQLAQGAGISAAMQQNYQTAYTENAEAQANAAAAGTATAAAANSTAQAATAAGEPNVAAAEANVAGLAASSANSSAAGSANAASAAQQAAGPQCTGFFSNLSVSCLLYNLLGSIVSMIGYLLGLVGAIFNWVIVVTVFNYANYFGNSGGMLIAWGILRDLGNILLLFGFIFMGICTILDLQTFSAKKALPSLLIFAVLLNFSLFAGEVVVDGANLLSAALYQQAGQSYVANGTCSNNPATCAEAVGIAGQIMKQTGISTIYNAAGVITLQPSLSNFILTYTGMIILMGVTMLVLLTGVVMFFTRAVMLTILLVLSPIGFAGMAIPPLQGLANEWWQKLISNAIFAPVFLLLIFIALKIIAGVTPSIGGSNMNLATALSSPSVSTSEVFIVFILVIGFMVAALMFAKSSGVAGAEFATKFAQRTVLAPVNGARRLAGVGVRESVGRGAVGLNGKYNQYMANHKGLATTARIFGIDSGVQGALKGVSNAKFGTAQGFEDRKKSTQHRVHELEGEAEKMAHAKELSAAVAMTAGHDRDIAISEALGKMSKEEKEQTPYLKKMADGMDQITRNLSQKDYDELLKSDNLSHDAKDRMKEDRFSEANADRTIKLMKTGVKDLPGKIIQKKNAAGEAYVLKAMTASQLKTLDPAEMDGDTLNAIKDYVSANPTDAKVQTFMALIGNGPATGPASRIKTDNTAANRWAGTF